MSEPTKAVTERNEVAHFDDRSVDPRIIPAKWLSDVKFFDHIQGTSTVCTWQCAVCFQKWDSNAKLPCPRCRPNWKDELLDMQPETEQREVPERIDIRLKWGANTQREQGKTHIEWHAPCGCAFHPDPFPHVHPCTNEHKRPDLHTLTEETEREKVLRRRRATMPDYDKKLEGWLS